METLEDMEQMAESVFQWYDAVQKRTAHYLELPTGMQMQIGEDIKLLDGSFLEGFKAGIEVALIELRSVRPIIVTDD